MKDRIGIAIIALVSPSHQLRLSFCWMLPL